jgi:hypothetical protein
VRAKDVLRRIATFGGAHAGGARPGATLWGFNDLDEFTEEAEALGRCATFLVEHRFTGWNWRRRGCRLGSRYSRRRSAPVTPCKAATASPRSRFRPQFTGLEVPHDP